ncbi:acyl carrier protein [Companilactobacillus nuruki]|uniref:Acyl carrier protein n=1 Tax=Companilactobacillus nuruki TaxID=1993540 RepID=A0A2N7AWA6_9LACO|nr:acyl carrier protein [Companilactobacillus nuruki]PMD73028.1 acyl carrier protein [Companilactobacillus nuruki]
MKTKEEIFTDLKNILIDRQNIDESKIKENTNLKKDLDLDSLDVFELIDVVEDKYDIEIDTDTDQGIDTVGGLTEYIYKVIAEKQ